MSNILASIPPNNTAAIRVGGGDYVALLDSIEAVRDAADQIRDEAVIEIMAIKDAAVSETDAIRDTTESYRDESYDFKEEAKGWGSCPGRWCRKRRPLR
ncbi:MAG: hypothetical protein V7704_20585 [Aurantimonas endophytica]|uniref:hypothetical protein n=1 Tax=Aurantimonas endophytica TaxID=1522175 RepID=UPI003001DCD8